MRASLRRLSTIRELSYLSHIVFRLWEDMTVPEDTPERYMVECSFSPGTPFDLAATLAPPAVADEASTKNSLVDTPGTDAYFAANDLPLESPTLPLQQFAYIPCERLEDYFDARPTRSAESDLADANAKYDDLARRLIKVATGISSDR